MSLTQVTFETMREALASDTGLTTPSGSTTTTTGSITQGTNTLTVANATSFSAGHGISIAGAGVGGNRLYTWIDSIDGTEFTLRIKAVQSVSGAAVIHDDRFVVPSAQILPVRPNRKAVFPALALRMDGAAGNNFPDLLSGMYFIYAYYQSEPGSSGQPSTVLNLICDRVGSILHKREDDISNEAVRIQIMREIFKSGIILEDDISETTHSQAMHYEYLSQKL